MKWTLVAALTLLSQGVFAQALPAKQGAPVIQAVRDSLTINDLNCVEEISRYALRASQLNWSALKGGEVSVNEKVQPVIKIKVIGNEREIIGLVTTNAELNQVLNIEITVSDIIKELRNMGTITRPRYEEITIRKRIESIKCN